MKAKLIIRTIQVLEPKEQIYEVRDTDLPGFLLRVMPSGTMSYFCDFRRPDGRRTRLKLGDTSVLTPIQARDEALKILGDLARGFDPAAVKKSVHQDTLESFIAKRYQPWAVAHQRTGHETVSRTLKRFAEFRETKLSEITGWKIEKWRSQRIKDGIKPATVNRNLAMLKSILQKAVEWEVIETNPIRRVKLLRIDHSAKVRFLTYEEEKSLRGSLDERESRLREERRSHIQWCSEREYPLPLDLNLWYFADHLKPMVLISLNTGLRRGELFNLKWADIDFHQKVLTVTGDTAKSGKTRHISLNQEALKTLEEWKKQSSEQQGLVFSNQKGQRFDNIDSSWQSLLRAAGIKNFRWHDLRHHFASSLVMRGVDLNTVRELLGHGDIKMTLRYAHLAPQIKADAVAKLDSPLLSVFNRAANLKVVV